MSTEIQSGSQIRVLRNCVSALTPIKKGEAPKWEFLKAGDIVTAVMVVESAAQRETLVFYEVHENLVNHLPLEDVELVPPEWVPASEDVLREILGA